MAQPFPRARRIRNGRTRPVEEGDPAQTLETRPRDQSIQRPRPCLFQRHVDRQRPRQMDVLSRVVAIHRTKIIPGRDRERRPRAMSDRSERRSHPPESDQRPDPVPGDVEDHVTRDVCK